MFRFFVVLLVLGFCPEFGTCTLHGQTSTMFDFAFTNQVPAEFPVRVFRVIRSGLI